MANWAKFCFSLFSSYRRLGKGSFNLRLSLPLRPGAGHSLPSHSLDRGRQVKWSSSPLLTNGKGGNQMRHVEDERRGGTQPSGSRRPDDNVDDDGNDALRLASFLSPHATVFSRASPSPSQGPKKHSGGETGSSQTRRCHGKNEHALPDSARPLFALSAERPFGR